MTDDPDDAPELLDEFFRTGEVCVGGKIVRRGRPPLGAQPKSSVTLRLDADVLDAYRALGRGWQSQINADLRRVRKLKKA
ncbi:BrnA antitoxin family protein [Rhodopseudomonas sp. WA056]|uniref:BrnA antitoxin family protein n=1 Tax=Rhodopseudomonas sp. WA056 TaxID=2269367 RepID=UPI001FEE0D6A|nr:BrnA antitoxin family protein [Rhodopseudomonas sp. WA056]